MRGASLFFLLAAVSATGARAVEADLAAPAPSRKSLPAASSATPRAQPPGRTPVDVDVNSLQPYNLPQASREKMHRCGDEWRKLKTAGQTNGLIWRTFAEKCLTR